MKRVPEGTVVVPSREEQWRLLQEKLMGHEAFARLRGKMGHRLDVRGLLQEAGSPSAFCETWDRSTADVRVMGNMVAQLMRDGWDDAAAALLNALYDFTYTFPGETVPIHETVPITVLIVDFPRTLAMIKWIRGGHWKDLDASILGEDCGKLARDLFNQFPSLARHSYERRQRGEYEGCDLVAAYQEDVLHQLRNIVGGYVKGIDNLQIAHGTYNDHLEVGQGVMGYSVRFGFLFQEEQDTVLQRIPRELQHLVSTWHCRVPKKLFENKYRRLYFGFHPEDRHTEWAHKERSFPSIGCSNGCGMVILDAGPENMLEYLHRYNHDMSGCGDCRIQKGEGFAFVLEECKF